MKQWETGVLRIDPPFYLRENSFHKKRGWALLLAKVPFVLSTSLSKFRPKKERGSEATLGGQRGRKRRKHF